MPFCHFMWKWTLILVATSNEGLIKIEVPHRDSKVNQKTISNNQSWYLSPSPLSSWKLIIGHHDWVCWIPKSLSGIFPKMGYTY